MTEKFMIRKVDQLSTQFPQASFKYFQTPTGTTHFVIVEGVDMDSDEFVDAQYDVLMEFLAEHGDETIAFAPIDELKLFPSLEFVYKPVNLWSLLNEEISFQGARYSTAPTYDYCPLYALVA